jgi:hypothetical protein
MITPSRILFAAAGLAAAVGLATADGHRPPGRGRGVPREAIEACNGKAAGDACSLTIHDRTITGTCRAPAGPGAGSGSDAALACLPDRPPGPPPAAVDACSGKAEGDACSVSDGDHAFDGTCRKGPDGNGPLACAPAR